MCPGLNPPCRPGLSGHSATPRGSVLLGVQTRGDPSQQCQPGVPRRGHHMGLVFRLSMERGEEGHPSQMADFHVWDAIAVEDLKEVSLQKERLPLGPS